MSKPFSFNVGPQVGFYTIGGNTKLDAGVRVGGQLTNKSQTLFMRAEGTAGTKGSIGAAAGVNIPLGKEDSKWSLTGEVYGKGVRDWSHTFEDKTLTTEKDIVLDNNANILTRNIKTNVDITINRPQGQYHEYKKEDVAPKTKSYGELGANAMVNFKSGPLSVSLGVNVNGRSDARDDTLYTNTEITVLTPHGSHEGISETRITKDRKSGVTVSPMGKVEYKVGKNTSLVADGNVKEGSLGFRANF